MEHGEFSVQYAGALWYEATRGETEREEERRITASLYKRPPFLVLRLIRLK